MIFASKYLLSLFSTLFCYYWALVSGLWWVSFLIIILMVWFSDYHWPFIQRTLLVCIVVAPLFVCSRSVAPLLLSLHVAPPFCLVPVLVMSLSCACSLNVSPLLCLLPVLVMLPPSLSCACSRNVPPLSCGFLLMLPPFFILCLFS